MPDKTIKHKRKTAPKHWYKQYVGECPVCGSDKSYRERVLGNKPKNPAKRYEQLSGNFCFDNCIY